MAYAFSKQVTDLHPYPQILLLLLEFLERNLEQVTFSRICAFPLSIPSIHSDIVLYLTLEFTCLVKLKHGTPNPTSLSIDCDSDQPHWGWSWLERWTAARPWQNHHFSDQDYCQTLSPGKFSGDSRQEVESGSLTKAKDGECLQADPYNPQIISQNSVQESLLNSVPFPLQTPPFCVATLCN
jgi:hypothetical protein